MNIDAEGVVRFGFAIIASRPGLLALGQEDFGVNA